MYRPDEHSKSEMMAQLRRSSSSPDQGRLSRNSQGKKFHPFNAIALRKMKRRVSNSSVTTAEDSLLCDASCDSSARSSSGSSTPVANGLKSSGKSRRRKSSRKPLRKLSNIFKKQIRDENDDYVSSPGAIMSQKDDLQKDDDSRSNHTRDTDVSSMSALTSVHASTIMPEKEGSPPFVVLPLPPMMRRVSTTLYSISDCEDENTNIITEEEKPSEIVKSESKTESMTEDGNSQQHRKSRTFKVNSGKKKKRRSTLCKKKSRRSMRIVAEQIHEQRKSIAGLNMDFLGRNSILSGSDRDVFFNIMSVSIDNRIAIADDYHDSSSSSDDDSDGLKKRSIYYQATEERVFDVSEMQESITEQTLRSSCVLVAFGDDDVLSLDVGNDFNPVADSGLLKRFYREAIMKSFKDQTVSRISSSNMEGGKAQDQSCNLNEAVSKESLNQGVPNTVNLVVTRGGEAIAEDAVSKWLNGFSSIELSSQDNMSSISVVTTGSKTVVDQLTMHSERNFKQEVIEERSQCTLEIKLGSLGYAAGEMTIVSDSGDESLKEGLPGTVKSQIKFTSLDSAEREMPAITGSTDDLEVGSVLHEAQSLVKWLELPKPRTSSAPECVIIENSGSSKATAEVDGLNNNLKEQEDEINALKEIKSDRETLNTKIKMELSTLDNYINRVQTKLIDGKYDLTQAKAHEDVMSLQLSDVITHYDKRVNYLSDKVQEMYASIRDLEEETQAMEEDVARKPNAAAVTTRRNFSFFNLPF